MGRRNTRPKSYLQVFQWLNSFASADSKKTLPCLGFIGYRPKHQVSLKSTIGSWVVSRGFPNGHFPCEVGRVANCQRLWILRSIFDVFGVLDPPRHAILSSPIKR